MKNILHILINILLLHKGFILFDSILFDSIIHIYLTYYEDRYFLRRYFIIYYLEGTFDSTKVFWISTRLAHPKR